MALHTAPARSWHREIRRDQRTVVAISTSQRHLHYPEGTYADPTRRATYPVELPVLALRETVVFPLTLQPLAITRPMSIESVNRALAGDRLLFLALQTTDDEEPAARAICKQIGTIAAIRQMAKVPNGGVHVIVEGLARARADVDHAQRPGAARDGDAGCRNRPSARSRSTRTSAASTN